MSRIKRLELLPIRLYQSVRFGRPTTCRYFPSCSQYAVDALQEHGFWRANKLIVGRLSRCHPLGGWGPDPVPPRKGVHS